MEVVLWGVRGSRPVCGKNFEKYGGNTTCLEVRSKNGESILLDAGTGIASWEKHTQKTPVICLTHFHLDHLLGLPFLSSLYNPQSKLQIYAPILNTSPLEQLKKLFDGVFCPVSWNNLSAPAICQFLPGKSFTFGSLKISTALTCHPGGCVAYKITDGEWTFAYTGDHEMPLTAKTDCLTPFLTDADVILADASYSKEDHQRHINWGHSHFQQWAESVNPSFLVFTHYEPQYSDSKIDECIEDVKESYPDLNVAGAREYCIIRKNKQMNYELQNL